MIVQKTPLSQILPHPNNPRIALSPKDPVFRQIQKSYKAFGRLLPYIVNKRNNYCLSGNQRMAVDMAEGVTEAYVVFVDLDERAEKELMIALNRISGYWDNKKLATILEEFTDVPDFDFEAIGFSVPEVSQILDRYGTQKDADDYDFDATLESITEPITKRGDRIVVGSHVIVCGDSTNIEDGDLLMGGNKAGMVNTDPPYNIAYLGGDRPNTAKARPKRSRNWRAIYADNLSQEEYEAFLNKVFVNMDKYLTPGCSFYVWNGHNQFAPMHRMLKALNYHIGCVITWAKPNFAISYGDYHQQTEFCLYGWKEGEKHRWYGGVNESSLWSVKREPTAKYIHPTTKPTELAQRAIRNSSERGDIVLDLFLGSGSTLIASEILGRRCFGIEIDPRYVDAIIKRYINFVGHQNVPEELVRKYSPEVANV